MTMPNMRLFGMSGGAGSLWPLTIASNRTNNGAGYLVNNSTPASVPASSEFQNYFTSSSQSLATKTWGTSSFQMPIADGYIYFVVPVDGTYRIVARGGPGGPTGTTTYPGSGGAIVQADFVLQSGDYLWLTTGMAGSAGNPDTSDRASAAGGGLTAVALKTKVSGATTTFPGATSTMLLFAGGGVGSSEPRLGGTTTDSSANQGSGGSLSSWNNKSISSTGGGFGGQTAYGGWAGASGSDDSQGPGGGYTSLFSTTPDSFINTTLGTNLVRTNGTRVNTNWPNNGYVIINKVA